MGNLEVELMGLRFLRIPFNFSYVPKESEETATELPKEHNAPLAYTSEKNETVAGSLAIHNLFKKWLTMLRTQLPSQVVDEVLEEEPCTSEKHEALIETQSRERGGVLKVAMHNFWGLDATIKAPLLIFVLWYLAVNVVFGAQVSKELIPLWVIGPFAVALYIKFLRGLCALYVFTFKQTVKIVKNLPTYYLIAHNYLAKGKLNEDVRARVWQPMEDVKNMDSKGFSRRKLKEFQEWLTEMYLDFVESIWPHYCRTIRFLKRANLI
ncbi:uncharacterized protein [Rutidosis leptorrhynchoides]|uniref:uncharacterized protein n=1 Tax=Rutidosis leptorrhynchoides TaxID=125765 RepID=UPI003A999C2B